MTATSRLRKKAALALMLRWPRKKILKYSRVFSGFFFGSASPEGKIGLFPEPASVATGTAEARAALPWAILSAMGFSTMAFLMKRLSGAYPQWEIVFFRASINFAVACAVLAATGQAPIPKRHRRLLVFRGVMGTASLVCYVQAVYRLPLSIAAVLNQSSPVFVILVGWLAIGERLRARQIAMIMAAIAAAAVLIEPRLVLGFDASAAPIPLAGALFALAGAACSGMTFVAVRAASRKVGASVIIFFFTGIATLFSAPLAWRVFKAPDPLDLAILVSMGLAATVGQYAMTRAYSLAPAGLVSSFSLIGTAFTTFYGIGFFGERLLAPQWLALTVLAAALAGASVMNR